MNSALRLELASPFSPVSPCPGDANDVLSVARRRRSEPAANRDWMRIPFAPSTNVGPAQVS